MAFYGFTNMF